VITCRMAEQVLDRLEHGVGAAEVDGAASAPVQALMTPQPDRQPAGRAGGGVHRAVFLAAAGAGGAERAWVAASVVLAWAAWQGGSRVRVLAVAALGMGVILTVIPALLRFWVAGAASSDVWVPGSRYTASAILLVDAIAVVGVDAFLRRTDHS
jgi:hypothetical protein